MLGLGFMAIFSIESLFLRRLYYKIEGLFKSPLKLPPDSERDIVELPAEGKTISVETALNSRCTSDYDENPKKFHWGMFDRKKKLSQDQIKSIIDAAQIPRFTDRRVEIQVEDNLLTFIVDNQATGILKDWVMIESGMQQQAVGLVCSALGAGMLFKGIGDDGKEISKTELATVRMKLDAMKPTYNDSFWSKQPPSGRKSWLKGNLPDPERKGDKPLISTLLNLKIQRRNSKRSTDNDISQLLWADRGRTPHYYKSRPWGMTIPVSRGDQNISSVYVVNQGQVLEYENWHKNRPTHSLKKLAKIGHEFQDAMKEVVSPSNNYIVLGKNENSGRALWEIGYQLLNILLRALTLDLSYEASFLNERHIKMIQIAGIKGPVAAIRL